MKKKINSLHRAATINDVAELANTSAATVSRVLSKSGYPVNSETARRVTEAAQELNYVPNLAGRMLKSRSAKSLGLVIPSFQNPFFIQLVAGIEDAAASRDYVTFVFNSRRDVQVERNLIRNLSLLRIRGLLLSSLDSDSTYLDAFLASGGRAAVFESDYEFDDNSNIINAMPNMSENSSMAVNALLELGHRKIALLTTPLIKHNRRMVWKGYRSAMDAAGIPEDERLIIESSCERESDDTIYEFKVGCELADRFLAQGAGYTAIVAVNDLVACGIMHQMLKRGVRVPEDVSIIGIDNIPQDIMVSPTISTVDQDSYHHGYDVCMKLIDSLENPDKPFERRYYIPPKLIIRDSVKPLDR